MTHPAYRHLMVRYGGIDVVCTEFVRITKTKQREKKLRGAVVKSEGAKLSVQVMGREQAQMQSAAAAMSDAGADFVDINLGCPSPNAVRGGVGAAMLKDPDLVYRVASDMREVVGGTLTAKMRAGFDVGTDAQLDHVHNLCRALVRAGVDLITIHPRRRVDGYSGVADWRIVKKMVDALPVVVVGNGDCWYAADVLRMREETGCYGVMLGRGALRNPFIFQQVRQLERGESPLRPSGDDVVAHVHRLHDVFAAAFSRGAPVGKLKEHLRFLSRALVDRAERRRELLSPTDVGPLLCAVEHVFGGLPPDAIDLDAHGTLGLERSGSCALANPVGPPPRSFVGAFG